MRVLRPLSDRIVIKQVQLGISAGGIILPESVKNQSYQAEVIAVGPGRIRNDGNLIPMSVMPGDVILYGKFSGYEIKLDNEDIVIITEKDVLAVIEEAE